MKPKKTVNEMVAAITRQRLETNKAHESISSSAAIPARDKFSSWSILDTIVGTQQEVGTPHAIKEVDVDIET